MVWWITSWAEDEQLQGKNSLARRGVLVLGGVLEEESIVQTRCFLLWWLALFIEALVLSPNIEREGIQQQINSKGDN